MYGRGGAKRQGTQENEDDGDRRWGEVYTEQEVFVRSVWSDLQQPAQLLTFFKLKMFSGLMV